MYMYVHYTMISDQSSKHHSIILIIIMKYVKDNNTFIAFSKKRYDKQIICVIAFPLGNTFFTLGQKGRPKIQIPLCQTQ